MVKPLSLAKSLVGSIATGFSLFVVDKIAEKTWNFFTALREANKEIQKIKGNLGDSFYIPEIQMGGMLAGKKVEEVKKIQEIVESLKPLSTYTSHMGGDLIFFAKGFSDHIGDSEKKLKDMASLIEKIELTGLLNESDFHLLEKIFEDKEGNLSEGYKKIIEEIKSQGALSVQAFLESLKGAFKNPLVDTRKPKARDDVIQSTESIRKENSNFDVQGSLEQFLRGVNLFASMNSLKLENNIPGVQIAMDYLKVDADDFLSGFDNLISNIEIDLPFLKDSPLLSEITNLLTEAKENALTFKGSESEKDYRAAADKIATAISLLEVARSNDTKGFYLSSSESNSPDSLNFSGSSSYPTEEDINNLKEQQRELREIEERIQNMSLLYSIIQETELGREAILSSYVSEAQDLYDITQETLKSLISQKEEQEENLRISQDITQEVEKREEAAKKWIEYQEQLSQAERDFSQAKANLPYDKNELESHLKELEEFKKGFTKKSLKIKADIDINEKSLRDELEKINKEISGIEDFNGKIDESLLEKLKAERESIEKLLGKLEELKKMKILEKNSQKELEKV